MAPEHVQTCFLANEAETERLGRQMAQAILTQKKGFTLFLQGTLGMGKTTLSRGLIRGLGHQGSVKSPTYTLVEPYEHLSPIAYHFDLYRLGDPEELEYVGIRDYFQEHNVCLIEWAERGQGILPEPDVVIRLETQDEGRSAAFTARTDRGLQLLQILDRLMTPTDG